MSENGIGDNKSAPAEVKRSPTDENSSEIRAGAAGKLWSKVVRLFMVEIQGNEPVPAELQKDRRYFKLFTLWFSMNFNLLS